MQGSFSFSNGFRCTEADLFGDIPSDIRLSISGSRLHLSFPFPVRFLTSNHQIYIYNLPSNNVKKNLKIYIYIGSRFFYIWNPVDLNFSHCINVLIENVAKYISLYEVERRQFRIDPAQDAVISEVT